MKRLLLLASLAAFPAMANAQPAQVLEFHQQMGGGELLVGFCLFGQHVCVERRAIVYGQVCDSEAARTIGVGESGEYEGFVPPLFHYSGFRCGVGQKWHPKTDDIFGGGNWAN